MEFRAHPCSRGAATIGALVSASLIDRLDSLAALNALVLVFGLLVGQLPSQLRLLRTAILPLFLVLGLVWGAFLQTAPGGEIGSDPFAGLEHAGRLCMKLALIGTTAQALWLSVSAREIPAFLNAAFIRGNALVVALSFVAGFESVRQSVARVVIALQIRGRIKPYRWMSRLTAIPHVLINIWTPVLSLAVERVECKWDPQGFLDSAQVTPSVYVHAWSHDVLAIAGGALALLTAALEVAKLL